ncbi:hypothetical protein Taro_034634 [Colocasia esculenta]|uniref:Uncharacterized protein n=1 Tax=Colocasia esculenta TaxID=4460 RepID=A0A843WAM9_COLES|nr:hypothetical protein [Colocasia esculenta]
MRQSSVSRQACGLHSGHTLALRRVFVWRLALAGYPFPLSLLFFPLPSPPAMGELSSGDPSAERPASSCGAAERHRGARRQCPCIVKALHSFTAFPMLPSPCVYVCSSWATLGFRIPAVYPSSDVATARRVTTPEEALARLAPVATPFPVATRLSRCPSPSRWCRDGLRGRDRTYVALGASVGLICSEALAFSVRAWLAGGPLEGLYVPLACWACPRSERLLLLPGTPILGSLLREHSGLRACCELTADRADSGAEGKTVVWGSGVEGKTVVWGSGAESFVEVSCLGWDTEVVELVLFPARPRQSPISLPRSLLAPEPCRVVRREAAAWPVPTALAGEGLVIPIRPCSRGSPPYFLQLGARHRGSPVSDGLRRRLWCRVVVSSSESEHCTNYSHIPGMPKRLCLGANSIIHSNTRWIHGKGDRIDIIKDTWFGDRTLAAILQGPFEYSDSSLQEIVMDASHPLRIDVAFPVPVLSRSSHDSVAFSAPVLNTPSRSMQGSVTFYPEPVANLSWVRETEDELYTQEDGKDLE